MARTLPGIVVFTLISFVFRYFEVILNIMDGSRLDILPNIIPGYLFHDLTVFNL